MASYIFFFPLRGFLGRFTRVRVKEALSLVSRVFWLLFKHRREWLPTFSCRPDGVLTTITMNNCQLVCVKCCVSAHVSCTRVDKNTVLMLRVELD